MSIFLAKRFFALVITLLVASLVIFFLMEILPGDPASIILGVGAQEDTLAALRTEMGLNNSAPERYFRWISGILSGDFGRSYTYDIPVSTLILERLSLSLPLALLAISLSTLLAIPIGVLAVANHKRIADTGIMGLAQLGVAVPNFWFAILLILFFSVKLGWFSAGGFAGWEMGLAAALKSLTLPAISLALPQAAILARVTRSAVLETVREDFVRTARAKGLSRNAALWKHAFRNALIPVVTILGLQLSFLLAGTIIIENVFYLPGLGRLLFQAIAQRDLVVVKNIVILLAATVVIINFLVDMCYVAIDPRLRGGRA
ncbi:MAG: ABC transporter permease [Proteobacteria bacterium]|nr:MAG: ABC transporter permease [Pseudomonadota bacterium]